MNINSYKFVMQKYLYEHKKILHLGQTEQISPTFDKQKNNNR